MSTPLTPREPGHVEPCAFPNDACACSVPLFEHRALVTVAVAAERAAWVAHVEARFVSQSEVERALRAADAPEDSMATDDDLLRYEGRAEAVEIARALLAAERAGGEVRG